MRMLGIVAVILLGIGGGPAAAGEGVGVRGSTARFATAIDGRVGGKSVPMVLTGAAMRKKYGFSVYAIGSYVQRGAAVRDAETLAAADIPKQMHLVFERDVDGATMAGAFEETILLNYPASAFAPELARLTAFLRSRDVKRGDHIWLTSIPRGGFRCDMPGGSTLVIGNVAFARAVWEIYLGRNNIGVAVKTGLSSRL